MKRALALLMSLAAAGVQAANEPPIVAFQALVADNAGVTRRWEVYPLAAAFPDRYVDLADAPSIEALLKSHPGWRWEGLAPKGTVCSEIPVGFSGTEEAPVDTPPGRASTRNLTLLLVTTATPAIPLSVTPESLPRQLPLSEGPGRPSDDPMDMARRTVAERFGGRPEDVSLEKFGDFDFDGDGRLETVVVGRVAAPGRALAVRSLLMVTSRGLLALPVYSLEMAPGNAVMGVGDLNGDRAPDIAVMVAQGSRDFGLEIHSWRGRDIGRVFERRSYGCY